MIRRSILVSILTVLASCSQVLVHAQNNGALMPSVIPTFYNATGTAVNSLGFVCTYASGTTARLDTYQDSALTTVNQNPVRLNAAGRPVNGSTEVSMYLQARSYRVILYAAGTGQSCNGTSVGAPIRLVDNVYDLSLLNFYAPIVCASYAGADYGTKITAAVVALPSTGGTLDCRSLTGSQTISADVFSSITKPVDILIGATTLAVTASTTVPNAVVLHLDRGATISPSGGKTFTMVSVPQAGDYPIWGGAGNVRLRGPVRLAWWLNGGDGTSGNVYTSTDGTGGLGAASNALINSGGTAPDSAIIYAPCGNIAVTVHPQFVKETLYTGGGSLQPFPSVKGCGMGNTVFTAANGVAGLSVTSTCAAGCGAWTGGVLEDFEWDCTAKSSAGITLFHATRSSVNRVAVTGCTVGLDLSAGYQYAVTNSRLQFNNTGIEIENLANIVDIHDNEIGNNTAAAIDCRSAGSGLDPNNTCGKSIRIVKNDVESSGPVFIGSGGFDEISVHCEGMTTYCLRIGTDSSGNTAGDIPNVIFIHDVLDSASGSGTYKFDRIGVYHLLDGAAEGVTKFGSFFGGQVILSVNSNGLAVLEARSSGITGGSLPILFQTSNTDFIFNTIGPAATGYNLKMEVNGNYKGGLFVTASASGAISLVGPDDVTAFEISGNGNYVFDGVNGFSDWGGGTGGIVLMSRAGGNPTSNPAVGVLTYVDALTSDYVIRGINGEMLREKSTGTNRQCIFINGGMRLLALSGTVVADGGACP